MLQRSLLRRAPSAGLATCLLLACSTDASRLTVRVAERRDTSPALEWMVAGGTEVVRPECPGGGCVGPDDENHERQAFRGAAQPNGPMPDSATLRVEQRAHGKRPPLPVLESFDGLGVGFTGTNLPAIGRAHV